MVRAWGLEPQRITPQEPKSCMSANSIMPAYLIVPLFFHGEVTRGGAYSLIRYCSYFYTGKHPRQSISLFPQAAGVSPDCLLSYHAIHGSVNSFLLEAPRCFYRDPAGVSSGSPLFRSASLSGSLISQYPLQMHMPPAAVLFRSVNV